MGLRRDFACQGVSTTGERALVPGDEATEEGAAGGAGALSGNEGEGGGRYREGIELREGGNKGSEA